MQLVIKPSTGSESTLHFKDSSSTDLNSVHFPAKKWFVHHTYVWFVLYHITKIATVNKIHDKNKQRRHSLPLLSFDSSGLPTDLHQCFLTMETDSGGNLKHSKAWVPLVDSDVLYYSSVVSTEQAPQAVLICCYSWGLLFLRRYCHCQEPCPPAVFAKFH